MSQSIAYSGEGLWYKFSIQPGEQVNVQLSNLKANYHILLFSDIQQVATTQSSGTPNLPVIQAESSGNNDASTTFSPFYGAPFYGAPFYGAPFYGAPFYGAPFYGASVNGAPFYGAPFYGAPFYGAPFYGAAANEAAEADSILAESSQTGEVTQSVQANTWNDTGNFYVEVVSSDGTFSNTAYNLTVTTSGATCPGVTLRDYSTDLLTPVSGGSLPATTNAKGQPYSTVIVDNSTDMPNVLSTPLSTSLSSLATASNGVILNVAQSEGVQELRTQANANPSCPYAANLEAQGIQTLINTFRSSTSPGNLQYVVVIGDDHVIPFFRYADAETVGPENTYQVPLSSTSSAEAALANDFYLTDNQYGAASELAIDGTLLPIQSAAVGRLVETPADIQKAISGYLNKQVVTPTSTLTTGYSFMANPATQAGQYFADGVPAPGTTANPRYNDTLIDPATGGNDWTATQLQSSLTTRPHQLVFLGAHFNANDALAADDSTILSTQQFASSIGSNLQNAVVLGAGCHAGYTVDPADATPVTNTLSWPQAMTEAGATLIAGTGYQFGDSNYVADSDQVYVDIAQQLYQTGGKSVGVGSALLDAESQYLASLDQLNGLEEKSLLEVTLYGLPMLGVQEPAASTSPVPTPSQNGLQNTSNNQVKSGTPGSVLGTQEYEADVTVPALTPDKPAGATLSYDQLPSSIHDSNFSQVANGGEVADPGSPIVPVETADVNVAGETLTGVGFFGGSYTDSSGAPPLTGDPVTDTSQPATPFSSPVYYPEKLTNPNYFGTLDTGSGTELGITPEQYISDPNTPGNAIKRQFGAVDLHLFYSNNTASYGGNTPALAAAPDISNVTSTKTGTQVAVSATVNGDPSAGIQEVWVTYTDPPAGNGTGEWQSVELTPSSTNSSVWTGTFPDSTSGNAVFMVQAANGVGEVALNNNQGYFFSPTVVTGGTPPTPATSAITINSPGTTATYGSTASVSAFLSSTSAPGGLSGGQVTFSIGSATAVTTTGSEGVATAPIPLTGLSPGSYTLVASFAGDANDTPTSTSQPFMVTKPQTSLKLSLPTPGQLVTGSPNGISATLTSGGSGVAQKTVYFDVFSSASSATPIAGATGVTNQAGVAQAQISTLPPGSGYTVEAFFGTSPTPLPSNPSYSATDPDYGGSNTGPPTAVTVLDGRTISAPFAGPVTVASGQSLVVTSTVTGPVTVQAGGALDLAGGTVTGPITILTGGALQVQGGTVTGPISSSGAVAFTVCGATVTGPVTVTGSTGFVYIAGTGTGCTATKVTGSVTLSNNKAGVELIDTAVTGPVTITGNTPTVPITVAGNKIVGTLACSGNSPAPTDNAQSNTASVKTGQCDVPTSF